MKLETRLKSFAKILKHVFKDLCLAAHVCFTCWETVTSGELFLHGFQLIYRTGKELNLAS